MTWEVKRELGREYKPATVDDIDEIIYMSVVSQLPADASFEELVQALRAAGFFEPRKMVNYPRPEN